MMWGSVEKTALGLPAASGVLLAVVRSVAARVSRSICQMAPRKARNTMRGAPSSVYVVGRYVAAGGRLPSASCDVAVRFDLVYMRKVEVEAGDDLSDLPSIVQETVRVDLEKLAGKAALRDVAPQSQVELRVLVGSGSVALSKTAAPEGQSIKFLLGAADLAAIAAAMPSKPAPAPVLVERRAYFVLVGEGRFPFERSKLQVAPVSVAHGGWSQLGLDRLFRSEVPATSSIDWGATGYATASAAMGTPCGASSRWSSTRSRRRRALPAPPRSSETRTTATLSRSSTTRSSDIDTSIVGVRECLFVPFAITPFTIARAYRWRDLIRTAPAKCLRPKKKNSPSTSK